MEIMDLINKELEKLESMQIVGSNEVVYLTGRSKYMGDREFMGIIRPWTDEKIKMFEAFHNRKFKFEKGNLGENGFISTKQLKKN